MNVDELLSFTANTKLRDFAEPRLWSDETLLVFLNDGEKQFARRTHMLVDFESSFTELVTTSGQAAYALDKRIIHVMDVFSEEGTPLGPITRARRPSITGEGKPRQYALDAGSNTLRVYPVPDDQYTLYLTVARKPLRPLSLDDMDACPEIPEDYHSALGDYAAYRALQNNNAEGADMAGSAKEFLLAWEMAVKEAKRDVYRMRAGPSPRAVRSATFNRRMR